MKSENFHSKKIITFYHNTIQIDKKFIWLNANKFRSHTNIIWKISVRKQSFSDLKKREKWSYLRTNHRGNRCPSCYCKKLRPKYRRPALFWRDARVTSAKWLLLQRLSMLARGCTGTCWRERLGVLRVLKIWTLLIDKEVIRSFSTNGPYIASPSRRWAIYVNRVSIFWHGYLMN